MIKVKVFSCGTPDNLSKEVNSFISENKVDVVDVKFQSTSYAHCAAMVIYRDSVITKSSLMQDFGVEV